MGKTFAKVKVCHTNDFSSPRNEGIKRWVENNGGTFHQEIRTDTTHLVCSTKAWKRYHPLVKETRRHNETLPRSKRIKIVKYDWLEDSLQSKSRKPKETAPYDWEQKRLGHKPDSKSPAFCAIHADAPKPAEKKIETIDCKMIAFNQEVEEFAAIMQAKGYHPYKDSTGFLYLIILLRRDIEKNLIERHRIKVRYVTPSFATSIDSHTHHTCPVRQISFPAPSPLAAYPVVSAHRPARFRFRPHSLDRKLRIPIPNPWAHCLQLFESDTTPRKYACYLTYTAGRPGVKKEAQNLAPAGSDWEFAWAMFTKIFKLKTRFDWNERPESSEAKDAGLQIDGTNAENLKKYFEYVTPKVGEPQGLRSNCASGGLPEINVFDEEDTVGDVVQTMGRRLSVAMVMPASVTSVANDVEASTRTPVGGW